jgi:hypothetical protein
MELVFQFARRISDGERARILERKFSLNWIKGRKDFDDTHYCDYNNLMTPTFWGEV